MSSCEHSLSERAPRDVQALVGEGVCPWCREPLLRNPRGVGVLDPGSDEYAWCRCCSFGFQSGPQYVSIRSRRDSAGAYASLTLGEPGLASPGMTVRLVL